MMSGQLRGCFVTGTDTGVGKTYVSVLLVRALRELGMTVGVYKPVESGCERRAGRVIAADARQLWEAAGQPGELEHVCPQRFEAPLAPDEAARREGRQLDRSAIWDGFDYWAQRYQCLVVEGAGGLMTPVADNLFVVDLVAHFQLPLLVVSPNVLGTINQTLQTVFVARRSVAHVPIAGVVLNDRDDRQNDPSRESNFRQLQDYCRVPLLQHVKWGAERLEMDWVRSLFCSNRDFPAGNDIQ